MNSLPLNPMSYNPTLGFDPVKLVERAIAIGSIEKPKQTEFRKKYTNRPGTSRKGINLKQPVGEADLLAAWASIEFTHPRVSLADIRSRLKSVQIALARAHLINELTTGRGYGIRQTAAAIGVTENAASDARLRFLRSMKGNENQKTT